jgi:hypothetical protein
MKRYCVRVVETGVAHVEVEALDEHDARRQVEQMLEIGAVTFDDNAYEYDYDVSGQGEYEDHADIGL